MLFSNVLKAPFPAELLSEISFFRITRQVHHPYLRHHRRYISAKGPLFKNRERGAPGTDDIPIQGTRKIPIARLRRYAGTPPRSANSGKRAIRGAMRAVYQGWFFFFGQETICGRGVASWLSRASNSRCGGFPLSSQIRRRKSSRRGLVDHQFVHTKYMDRLDGIPDAQCGT
jgi:hypothetical protein